LQFGTVMCSSHAFLTRSALQRAGPGALPWLWTLAAVLGLAALVIGLGVLPADDAEGEAHRIALLHHPALWLSALLCTAMACLGAWGIVAGDGLALLLAGALMPTGALMSFIALWTGAMHDRPVSGAWWTGEASSVLEVLLLLLYLSLMVFKVAVGDPARADHACARFAVAGSAGLLLLWWLLPGTGPAVHPPQHGAADGAVGMQTAVALMAGAFTAHGLAACLCRARSLLLERGESPVGPSRRPVA
jgi:heme exporter protein C